MAISAVGVVGLAAPASATTNIGTPPGVILKLCVRIQPATEPQLCVYL